MQSAKVFADGSSDGKTWDVLCFCSRSHTTWCFSENCLEINLSFSGEYKICIRKFVVQAYKIKNQINSFAEFGVKEGAESGSQSSGRTCSRHCTDINTKIFLNSLAKVL